MKHVLFGRGVLLLVVLYSVVTGCRNAAAEKKAKFFPGGDPSINVRKSYSDLFLDSSSIERYIENVKPDEATAKNLRQFYNSRDYQYAWFNKKGINEQGNSFWNAYTGYIGLTQDSSLYKEELAKNIATFTERQGMPLNRTLLAKTDLDLTLQFFAFIKSAYKGRMDPADVQWYIPRKQVDALAFLDSVANDKNNSVLQWEPLNPQYEALKKKLVLYNSVSAKGGWDPIILPKGRTYKEGDSSAIVKAVKHRLALTEDYNDADSTGTFDNGFTETVKRSQNSFGIRQTGVINGELINSLNVPVKKRINTMMVNLERTRWLPEASVPDKIVANIPEFMLHVYENNNEVLSMAIVVGRAGNKTVVFSNQLKYIVFSPYWNVPPSIVRNEIMRRGGGLGNGMEVTGHSGGLPVIRQRPGPGNALGHVKFLFPNSYNIYFHDTPAKRLFDEEKRAFSHGCIRLANARALAIYLLRDDPEWDNDKIDEAMQLNHEKWVTLKKPVPVFITYFTSWVDNDGLLNFREDIYGHDKEMNKKLFSLTANDTDK